MAGCSDSYSAARELALPNLAHYPLRSILGVIGFTRRDPARQELTGTGQQTMVQQRASARGGFQMSPALTEIADWLTKIIVGLGLVQAGPIMSGFASIVRFLLQDARLDYFFAAGAVRASRHRGRPDRWLYGRVLLMALFIGRELAYAAVDMEALQTSAFRLANAAERPQRRN